MPTIHEQVSDQFAAWERRTRGWEIFPEPTRPEPPYRPFLGYSLDPVVDDGRRPTLLSTLASDFNRWLSNSPSPEPPHHNREDDPEPAVLIRDDLVELSTTLPANLNASRDALESFLAQLRACTEPIAFEIVGVSDRVLAQFVAHPTDVAVVRRQLIAHFPEATFQQSAGSLSPFALDGEHVVVEFGLSEEFLLPLATGKLDPFVSVIGALNELRPNECGVYQVLFEPCRERWAESIERLVTDATGGSTFVNRPEFVAGAKQKISRPIFAAVVRIASRADSFDDAWDIVRHLAGALRVFANPAGNELIPLRNDEYPPDAHVEDVLRRQSRRSGMVLNSDELVGFVHLPASAVRASRFRRQATTTKAAPRVFTRGGGILLGDNSHAGVSREIRLSAENRTRHMHVIGASGTGKSTFLFNLILQDVLAGEGLAVLDPHGDLIDRILGCIPPERVQDVVLVDPSDETASVGFNILSAHSDLEKTLLASDLVSVFQRLSTSWGDQMEGVLRNAILAFLESTQGGTLSDLRRFLLDPKFRERFLGTVTDPDITFYWRKGFSQLTGNKSIGPILTRLETFLAPKPIRYMVAQPVNRLDFAEIMDTRKIFLGKLSQGAIGKENAYLLGSLFMAKFQQTVMARQRETASARRDFWLYCDEFQNFITPSMGEILAGARKYRLGLILAHQELRQLERDRDVASALLSNCYTRVVFRVGDSDARSLENGFSSFTAKDLQNLGTGEAVARVERSNFDFNLTIPRPDDPDEEDSRHRRNEIVATSRARYATPRGHVEAMLRKQFETEEEPKKPDARKAAPPPTPPEPEPLPPVAEVPKAITPEVPPPPVTPPKPPPDLGRGGAQHQAIQKRLKEAGEKLGYKVTTEYPVLERTGSIDLVFEFKPRSIAVEITVTTTVDHEVGNVTKCLRAGFKAVAVVAANETKLKQIEEALRGALGVEAVAPVSFHTPDGFIKHLAGLGRNDPAQPQEPTVSTRRGYQVRRTAPTLTPEERKAREEAAFRNLAESMKQKPPEKGG